MADPLSKDIRDFMAENVGDGEAWARSGGEVASIDVDAKIGAATADLASAANLAAHVDDTANPHDVTAEQVGLGNVDNTADADKPISTATQAALDGKLAPSDLPGGDPAKVLTTGSVSSVILSGALAERPAAAASNIGWLYVATDVSGGTLYRSSGTSWAQISAGVSPATMVVATENQTVTNTTTLTPDLELSLPLAPNTTYLLEAFVAYNTATDADMRMKMTVSTVPINYFKWASRGAGTVAVSGVNAPGNVQLVDLSAQVVLGGIGADAVATPIGRIVTGGSVAGSLGMSFAQGTARETNTTRLAGSWMRLTEV